MELSNLSKGKRNFLVVLISFMVGIIYFVPYIRFTLYDQTLAAFQLSNVQLGLLGSVYGLVALFCYPISGILTDKFGPKILLTIAFLGTAVMTFWQSTFPNFTVMIIIYICFAFFTTATLWSPYVALLRNLGTEEEQGKIFGTSEAMRGVVSTVVGFIFIWILSLFASEMGGFRAIMIISAIVDVIFAVIAFMILPKSLQKEEKDGNTDSGEKHTIIDALKLPGVWLAGLFIFSCYNVIMSGTNYLGTFTTQMLSIDPALSSSLATIRTYIITILAGVLGGIIADKFKSRLIFLCYVLAIIAICAVATPFVSSLTWIAIVVTMVLALMYYIVKSTYFSILGDCGIPLAMTGIASGVVSFIGFIPDAFVTTMMGSWLDKDPVQGFNMIFMWMAAWAVVAIVLAGIIYRRSKKAKAE